MNKIKELRALQFALGIIFLMSGIPKFFAFNQLSERMEISGFFPISSDFFLLIAMLIEITGAISLFTNYKTKWSLPMLFVFVSYAIISMHTSLHPEMHLPRAVVSGLSAEQIEILIPEFMTANIIKVLANLVVLGALFSLYFMEKRKISYSL